MKTGRNDPCSCGSGRKFKKCCVFVAVDAPAAVAAAPGLASETGVAPEAPLARRSNTWVPLQHQAEALRPSRRGRKKPW